MRCTTYMQQSFLNYAGIHNICDYSYDIDLYDTDNKRSTRSNAFNLLNVEPKTAPL